MSLLTFKTLCRAETDHWSVDGEKITSPEKLEAIKKALEKSGPVLLEHRFYRGGCAPHHAVFDDFDDLVDYLKLNAKAGDAIHVWDVWPLMRDENRVAWGKCPAEDGAVPEGGAY